MLAAAVPIVLSCKIMFCLTVLSLDLNRFIYACFQNEAVKASFNVFEY